MNRRRLLGAVAGGFAALGGCLTGSGRDPDTPTPLDSRTPATPRNRGTDDAPGTTDATLWNDGTPDPGSLLQSVTVTPAVVGLDSPDSIGTYGDLDEQFVVATVAVGSSGPDPGAFALETADGTYEPVEEIGYAGRRLGSSTRATRGAATAGSPFGFPNPSPRRTRRSPGTAERTRLLTMPSTGSPGRRPSSRSGRSTGRTRSSSARRRS